MTGLEVPLRKRIGSFGLGRVQQQFRFKRELSLTYPGRKKKAASATAMVQIP